MIKLIDHNCLLNFQNPHNAPDIGCLLAFKNRLRIFIQQTKCLSTTSQTLNTPKTYIKHINKFSCCSWAFCPVNWGVLTFFEDMAIAQGIWFENTRNNWCIEILMEALLHDGLLNFNFHVHPQLRTAGLDYDSNNYYN